MKIDSVKIEELNPAIYNPRKLSDDQHENIKKSLELFGFVDPIIANSNPERMNTVIGGHQRLKVAEDLSMDVVPVFYVNLDEEKEKELNIRLNKNTGEWDWNALESNFTQEELLNWGFQDWELNFGDDLVDYSVLDEEELVDKLKEMTGEVKKALMIEFKEEDFEEAQRLVKSCREKGLYVGSILINALRKSA